MPLTKPQPPNPPSAPCPPTTVIRQVTGHHHLMSPARQGVDQVTRSALLDPNLVPAQPLPTWRIQCRLRIEPEIHQVHHHLHMPLRLHVAAHHPKRPKRLPTPGEEPGNDGVKGLFTRRETVGVLRVEAELLPTVLQGNPAVGHCGSPGLGD